MLCIAEATLICPPFGLLDGGKEIAVELLGADARRLQRLKKSLLGRVPVRIGLTGCIGVAISVRVRSELLGAGGWRTKRAGATARSRPLRRAGITQ